MPLYELDGVAPRIDADAYVHPDAVVIGDVTRRPRVERVARRGPARRLRDDHGRRRARPFRTAP